MKNLLIEDDLLLTEEIIEVVNSLDEFEINLFTYPSKVFVKPNYNHPSFTVFLEYPIEGISKFGVPVLGDYLEDQVGFPRLYNEIKWRINSKVFMRVYQNINYKVAKRPQGFYDLANYKQRS